MLLIETFANCFAETPTIGARNNALILLSREQLPNFFLIPCPAGTMHEFFINISGD